MAHNIPELPYHRRYEIRQSYVVLPEHLRASVANPEAVPVKFGQHAVSRGAIKARVHYSVGKRLLPYRHGEPQGLDPRGDAVTIYEKDYERMLPRVMRGEAYRNETDYHADYFDKGSVTLFSDSPYYAAAMRAARAAEASRQARRSKTRHSR